METLIFDTIGYTGVGLYVLSYALLNLGKLNGNGVPYLLMNLAAASLLLVSLSHTFNAPSFATQSIWVTLSLIGLGNIYRQKRRAKKMANAR